MTSNHPMNASETTPTIVSVTPDSAVAGTPITIQVDNYENVTALNFGNTTVNYPDFDNSGAYTMNAPSVISIESVQITVTALGGATSAPETFTYVQSPFLVRDNFSDSGGHSTGHYWISPDIISYGSDTLSISKAISTYDSGHYINKEFTNGQTNHFYIRAKNISDATQSGFVQMYISPASLLLTPETWIQIVGNDSSQTLSGSNGTDIEEGGICMSTPFDYQGVPSGGHYCVIAVASQTNGDGIFPIPKSFDNNAKMALWVQGNPNVSQRNMSYDPLDSNQGTFTMGIGNNNPNPATFTVYVNPEPGNGSETAFPSGTTVQVKVPGATPPYTSIELPWDPTNGASFANIIIPADIKGGPGNSLLTLETIITLPSGDTFAGKKPISITLGQNSSPPGMYEEEAHVLQNVQMAHPEDPSKTTVSNIIIMGSCYFRFDP